MITWNSKPNVNYSIEKIVKNGDYYECELWINYRVICLQCYWRVLLNIFGEGKKLSALGFRFNRSVYSELENSLRYSYYLVNF